MKYENLTDRQKQAVDGRGSMLVSAAAGSGKTAVLVERLIRAMTREDPVMADRLLVVTFTKAAAAEMRSRLERGLEDYCTEHPGDRLAAKQKILLQSARICTIDAFCIQLVKEHFERAGVDPDFSIADERQLAVLEQEAADEVIARHFESAEPEFVKLLDLVGTTYDESKLIEMIKQIYRRKENLPFPGEWIARLKEAYEDFFTWTNQAFFEAEEALSDAVELTASMRRLLAGDDQMNSRYSDTLEEMVRQLKQVEGMIQNRNWDGLVTFMECLSLPRLPSWSGHKDDPAVLRIKQLKESVKTVLVKDIGGLFDAPLNQKKADYEQVAPGHRMLLSLTEEFDRVLMQKKEKQGVLSYADTEQKALSLFCRMEDGRIVPAEGSEELIGAYDEVLVDEYQDVNDLQDLLFSYLSDRDRHLFLVGDVKQSIYGFRGANPENFLSRRNKSASADSPDGPIQGLTLHENFRSRPGICQFINFVFSLLMTRENGGIEYGETERLNPAAAFPDTTEPSVEVHLLSYDKQMGSVQSEARHVADTILAMMAEQTPIYDSSQKVMRPVRYGDIAVLLRKSKDLASVIAGELKARGIPVTYAKEQFLTCREVSWMLSLLSTIANPTRELPLLTVMMSPLYGFTPDETARIRLLKRGDLYADVLCAAQNGDEKAQKLRDDLGRYRRMAAVFPVDKLIGLLYDETGLTGLVSLMSDGASRCANLMMLKSEASVYEASFDGGLNGFIRHLKQYYGDVRAAGVSAGGDAVRLMTIHQSKGLQFPVCILPCLSMRFNNQEQRNNLICDVKQGIAFGFYDEVAGKRTPLPRQILAKTARQTMLAEGLRLLYVAMTRAESKLICVLGHEDTEKAVCSAANMLTQEHPCVTKRCYLAANSYADWLLPALFYHPDGTLLREIAGYNPLLLPENGPFRLLCCSVSPMILDEGTAIEAEPDKAVYQALQERFSYHYPYEPMLSVLSKVSVSQLIRNDDRIGDDFTVRPDFMESSGLSAPRRGTAVHRLVECMDFAAARADLESEINRLVEWEYVTREQADAVEIRHIRAFLDSPLMDRLLSADFVKREMQFLTTIPAGRLKEDLPSELAAEPVVIQGAVDCVFGDPDGLTIVDFKTDRVKDENRLLEAYAPQLVCYANACERIFARPVKQLLLYSFHLDREIPVFYNR